MMDWQVTGGRWTIRGLAMRGVPGGEWRWSLGQAWDTGLGHRLGKRSDTGQHCLRGSNPLPRSCQQWEIRPGAQRRDLGYRCGFGCHWYPGGTSVHGCGTGGVGASWFSQEQPQRGVGEWDRDGGKLVGVSQGRPLRFSPTGGLLRGWRLGSYVYSSAGLGGPPLGDWSLFL